MAGINAYEKYHFYIILSYFRGAWNKLGQMDKEEAMLAYVDELKKVLNQQYPQGYNKEEVNSSRRRTACSVFLLTLQAFSHITNLWLMVTPTTLDFLISIWSSSHF